MARIFLTFVLGLFGAFWVSDTANADDGLIGLIQQTQEKFKAQTSRSTALTDQEIAQLSAIPTDYEQLIQTDIANTNIQAEANRSANIRPLVKPKARPQRQMSYGITADLLPSESRSRASAN